MRKRTRARELALQHLYTVDLRGADDAENLAAWLETQTNDTRIRAFAADVATGCLEHQAAIDTEIKRVAKNWDFHRIAVVDRNILRLAVYEMLHRGDIPPRVTLNEAIELAKRFSTSESGGFVNALLDKIRADHKLDPDKARAPARSAVEPDGEMEDVAQNADD
ncbi:MAG: transcription antitermination factor NusB [Planctomycetes bacterium]|nr:transcription antitermination factor NusB [Planctomycetota bacterium]MCC7171915.1 transcription antitermination factor NusB [Planctomycetota bacterium]